MKTRIITAALAAFFILPLFCMTAYAAPVDAPEDVITEDMDAVTDNAVATEEAPATVDITFIEDLIALMGANDGEMPITNENPVTDCPETPPRPFTPAGTGTVIDNANSGDGKEFYTIMTPDEHVFYLVIDKQRNAENVYFLNAVTIADLAALAEIPAQVQAAPVTAAPPAETTQAPDPAPPAPEQEKGGGNMGMYIFIGAIVILGGGAGWYFKIYRPKQQGTHGGDEYEPPVADEDNDFPGDWDDEQVDADDSPPWDDDEDESGDESGDER